MKFDLSKMKKKHSAKDHTIMVHPDGHEIKIAHNALSSKMREQLDAIPMVKIEAAKKQENPKLKESGKHLDHVETFSAGGGVKDKKDTTNGGIKVKETPAPKASPSKEVAPGVFRVGEGAINIKKRGKPEKYADGGEVEDSDENSPEVKQAVDTIGALQYDKRRKMQQMGVTAPAEDEQNYAKGGQVCQHCGGPVHNYAFGGGPEADPELAPYMQNQSVAPTQAPMELPTEPKPQAATPQDEIFQSALSSAREKLAPDVYDPVSGATTKGMLSPTMEARAREEALQQTKQGLQSEALTEKNQAAQQAALAAEQAKEQQKYKELGITPPAPIAPAANVPAAQPAGMSAPARKGPAIPPKAAEPAMEPPKDAYEAGVQKELQGIRALVDVEEQQGRMQAAAAMEQQRAMEAVNKQYQERMAHYDSYRQSIEDDMREGYINPMHIFSDQTAAQKVGTAFSLLLGGIGGGLTGKDNPVWKFLNEQMERDFQMQKAKKDQANSLYGHLMSQLGHEVAADNMLRMNINDAYKMQLEKAAAATKGPRAAAAAQQAEGQLLQKNYMYLDTVSKEGIPQMSSPGSIPGFPGTGSATAGQPAAKPRSEVMMERLPKMRMMNPEYAKKVEATIIPGVGVAAMPLEKEDKDHISELGVFEKKLRRAIDFAQQHGGISGEGVLASLGLPTGSKVTGETMAAELGNAKRMAEKMGVFKKSENEFVTSMLGDNPAKFGSAFFTVPKLREALRALEIDKKAIYTKFNIKEDQQTGGSSTVSGGIQFTPAKRK